MPLEESTPSEYQRVFAEMAQERPDAIIVHDIGDLIPYRELIIELVEKGIRSTALSRIDRARVLEVRIQSSPAASRRTIGHHRLSANGRRLL